MVAVLGSASAPQYYLRQQASFSRTDGKQGLEVDGAWWNPHKLFNLPDGGSIRSGALDRLYEARDPEDNRCLTRSANYSRRKPAYDIVFSADKSVSALWAIADPQTRAGIAEAHDTAVRTALSEIIEQYWATTRVRSVDFSRVQVTVQILAATFRHTGNVNGEPDLHTHCVIPKICWNTWDSNWRSLEPRSIAWVALGASTFRNALAWNLQKKIGVHMEHHGNGRFTRIAGMPDGLLRQWSERSRQIRETFGIRVSSSRNPGWTRRIANTPHDRSAEERDLRWQREAALSDRTGFVAMVTGRPPRTTRLRELNEAIDRLPEAAERSTIRFWELAARVENMTAGMLDREGVMRTLLRATMHKDLRVLDNRPLFADRRIAHMPARSFDIRSTRATTERLRALELKPDYHVRLDRNDVDIAIDRLVGHGHIKASSRHIAAIRLAASSHRLMVLEIDTGPERAAILRTIVDLHRQRGCNLMAAAADSRTTASLITDCRIPAKTFFKALRENTPVLPANRDAVIIIDEADQLSLPESYRLLDRHRDAKIIFLAEPGQAVPGLDPIEHCIAREERQRNTHAAAPVVPGAVRFEETLEETLKRITEAWYGAADKTRCILVRSANEALVLNWIVRRKQAQSQGTIVRVADKTGYNTRPLEISKGDTLYLCATSWKRNLTAGTLVVVDDLWTIPGDAQNHLVIHGRKSDGSDVLFRHDEIRDCKGNCALSHGYALPIAAARNLVVDKVMLLADPGLTSSELAASMKNHRETFELYVDRRSAKRRLGVPDTGVSDTDLLKHLERAWSRSLPEAVTPQVEDAPMPDPAKVGPPIWLRANDIGNGAMRQLARSFEKSTLLIRHDSDIDRLAAGTRRVEAEHAGFEQLSNSMGRGVYRHPQYGSTLDHHRDLIAEVSRFHRFRLLGLVWQRAGLSRTWMSDFEHLYDKGCKHRQDARRIRCPELSEGLLNDFLKTPLQKAAIGTWREVKRDLDEILTRAEGQLAGAIYMEGHADLMQRMRTLVENEHLDRPLRQDVGETLEQFEHAVLARNRVESCVREIEAMARLREAISGAATDVNITTLPSWRRWREESERLGARARAILADEDDVHVENSDRSKLEAAAGTRYSAEREISRNTGYGGLA